MFSTITTAPAKQSVGETISILSGRLSSATLLEDRRAAILGLRSFAKEYPASVASGALRSLIGSLSQDGEDVDTVKVVLETLLMLFTPNADSPEASDEIALWVADEFTTRTENITLLLDLLATQDFYSRLYSLQLMAFILRARTERMEECVFVAPMGVGRLVAVLDDPREAVRAEAITLLSDLTPASAEIQKLVAFERGFERVFAIIAQEGGVLLGGRMVEDCLVLLANLLRFNTSNQSMFREMGFIAQIGKLLEAACQAETDGEEVATWAAAQRNRNVYALLAVIRLFLLAGAVGTAQNQAAFLRDRVLDNALQLAFSPACELPIRANALVTCAPIIRGNSKLQENFASLQVPAPLHVPAQGQDARLNGVPKVFVIDGLLDLILSTHTVQAFDMRMAACACLKAYFFNHAEVRSHFLRRAIEGHRAGGEELTNVLTTVLQPLPESAAADPYRFWFAAVLMLHLLHENPTTKALVMGVTEGDEASGEEVVTSIQTVTAHFLSSVTKNEDVRILTGYLMLLLCWMFEDLDAVNDFLSEFTNLQGLIQAAVENPNGDVIVQGLSAMLLGVIYDFSTKDSPVARAKVRETIMSRMGRDLYVEKLTRLRSHLLMRDYEVLPQKLADDAAGDVKMPDVFFDDTFVEFFKDNFSRVLRAIDRDPGLEISVVTNGVQKGISRELVDSLRTQVEEKDRARQDAEVEKASLERQLGQEQADHRRTKETGAAELARAKEAIDALSAEFEAAQSTIHDVTARRAAVARDLDQEQVEHRKARAEIVRLNKAAETLQRQRQEDAAAAQKTARAQEEGAKRNLDAAQREAKTREDELKRLVDAARRTAEQESERLRRRSEAEKADLKATLSRLEVDLMKANKARSVAESKSTEVEAKLEAETTKAADAERRLRVAEDAIKKATADLGGKEEEKKSVQNELDDLLIVFSDLEEKAAKYKERLRALGETISDDEDGEEGGGDDEVD